MYNQDQRKVVLVGTGMVGMSYAYALLNQPICNELVLIDIDKKKAEGEAMDLNHGLAFASSHMKIRAGEYADCHDADLVVICAGVAQKPGESRLDLLQRNADVLRSIVEPIVESGFSGIFLAATNPVDVITQIIKDLSGFPAERVIGSGTTLDSARLRYMIGDYFHVDPRNVHAYVIGEHGDTEFVPWSQAMISTKSVLELCGEMENMENGCKFCDLVEIGDQVRTSAQKIIEAKKATYFGIGMSLVRITKAIFDDENSVLTVSVLTTGQYGIHGVYLGLPAIINRNGVRSILNLRLSEEEVAKLQQSAATLAEFYAKLRIK